MQGWTIYCFCRASGIIGTFMRDMNKQISKFNIHKKINKLDGCGQSDKVLLSLLIDYFKYNWKRTVNCSKQKVNLVTRLLLGVALVRFEPSLHDVELTFELGFGNLRTRIMWQCIGL
jgi:hypothetical protein